MDCFAFARGLNIPILTMLKQYCEVRIDDVSRFLTVRLRVSAAAGGMAAARKRLAVGGGDRVMSAAWQAVTEQLQSDYRFAAMYNKFQDDGDVLNAIYLPILNRLYLNFDTRQDFLQQLRDNYGHLRKLLDALHQAIFHL
jgi:hypothetical protein